MGVIVADDITGEALSSLVLNKIRGVLDVVALRALHLVSVARIIYKIWQLLLELLSYQMT